MKIILSMCNEGKKVLPCLESLNKFNTYIDILHDGKVNKNTKKILLRFKTRIHEFPKIGCKEPHLTHFISKLGNNESILHVDYDEVITGKLFDEIKRMKFKTSFPIAVNMQHESNKNDILYQDQASRSSKVIFFNTKNIQTIIGLPHKGIFFNSKPLFFRNIIKHNASHINNSLLDHIRRDLHFSNLDALLRFFPIVIFSKQKLYMVGSNSRDIGYKDYLRFKYPILLYVPIIIFRVFQSFLWFFQVRNFSTFKYEFKIFISRIIYQINLLNKIILYKYFSKN